MNFLYSEKLYTLMEDSNKVVSNNIMLVEELYNSSVLLESEETESFKDKLLKLIQRIIEGIKKYLLKLRDLAKKLFRKVLGKFSKRFEGTEYKLKGFDKFADFANDSGKFSDLISKAISFIAEQADISKLKEIDSDIEKEALSYFSSADKYTSSTESNYTPKDLEGFKQQLQMIIGQFNSTNDNLLKILENVGNQVAKVKSLINARQQSGDASAISKIEAATKPLFYNAKFLNKLSVNNNTWLKVHGDFSEKIVKATEVKSGD